VWGKVGVAVKNLGKIEFRRWRKK